MQQRNIFSLGGVLILGLIVLMLNGLSQRFLDRFYIDLTEEGLYSLSPGSKNIVEKLHYPLTINLYISKTEATKYPAIKLYGDRVLSLLREFERLGKGKVVLKVFDPRPDTDEESWAQKYGLTPLSMPGGEKVFFGLAAVNAVGVEEVIPVFSLARQEFLEYDITKAIYSLSLDKKPVVGLISSLPVLGEQSPQSNPFAPQTGSQPWVSFSQISQIAEVRDLKSEVTAIDTDVKALIVLHPKNLSQKTLFAIDQFVMRGGNLIVAIDPHSMNQSNTNEKSAADAVAATSSSSNLKGLLTKWGIEMDETKAVGDINLATKVSGRDGQSAEDFVLWLTLDGRKFALPKLGVAPTAKDAGEDKVQEGETINHSNILTSQLENLLFPWAGALRYTPVVGLTYEPLLESTPQAMMYGSEDFLTNGGSPNRLLDKYIPGREPLVIAAKLSGRFKSNFSVPEGEAKEFLAEGKQDAHVVVIADVDFLADNASVVSQNFLGAKMVSAVNDNLAFASNLVENMLGSSDLISLRSRGQFTRPFTRVEEIEKGAEQRFRVEEMTLQASLNEINRSLSQLQSGQGDAKEKVISQEIIEQVKKFKERRIEAQTKLRQVRKNLRQEKEALGTTLFLLNTFFVPAILLVFALVKRK